LYAEEANPSTIAADYRGIFSDADRVPDLTIYEVEILYLYSMNETVRKAIDYTVEGNNTPADYKRVREALIRSRPSDDLRQFLLEIQP
jgi:hypothetical protein